MEKHELRSVMFKYQMMAIQQNMGNEMHSLQSNVYYTYFVSPPPIPNWYHQRHAKEKWIIPNDLCKFYYKWNEMYNTFITNYFKTLFLFVTLKIDKVYSIHCYPGGSHSCVARNNLIKHLRWSVLRKKYGL